MDATIRLLERRALEDPTDDAVAGHLVRALARAGKSREARRVARSHFAARRVDTETIATVLEVGGELIEGRDRPETPRANVGYVVGRAGARAQGFAEIVPTIAFASIPGAGGRENALALRDLFGVEDLFVQRADRLLLVAPPTDEAEGGDGRRRQHDAAERERRGVAVDVPGLERRR